MLVNGVWFFNFSLVIDLEFFWLYVFSFVEVGCEVVIIMYLYGGKVGINVLYGFSCEVCLKKGFGGGIV